MLKPVPLNAAPLTEALEMVTVLPPVFLICTVCVFVVPVATVPKLMLDGVVLIVPLTLPVPLSESRVVAVPTTNSTYAE